MKKIVFATNNKHKLEELKKLTQGKIEILSLADIGCNEDIAETADTLEGNAAIKASYIKDNYGYDCFADDTGLEVNALDGAPGVYSARYAGDGHNSQANMHLLLENMKGMRDRSARFRTVIALVEGSDKHFFEGIVKGSITEIAAGDSGFGYDPVFMPEGWNITFAEMTSSEKNSISHRARAVAKLIDYLAL